MTTLDTIRVPWRPLHQATVNVADGLTANVNTSALAYSGTWATSAQNPANWPSQSVPVPLEANQAIIMFIVSDTADDEGTCTIWGKDSNGVPRILVVLNPVRAGTSVVDVDPSTQARTGAPGTSLRYVDFDAGAVLAVPGAIVVGGTSGATGIVDRVVTTSGTYAAGDALGQVYLSDVSGTWQNDDDIDSPAGVTYSVATGALLQFYYADTVTATRNNVGATVISNASNDIAEVRFDLRDNESLFVDWDMNLGGGTDGIDAIAYWTYI